MDDNLAARVGRIIPRYSMLAAGDRAGVAVSGGADSVALLHILHRLAPHWGVGLKVLHVNHALRGRESEEDEAFVRELAGALELECVVERAPIAEGNMEEQARLARRAFFQRCREEHGLARIALGHTRSDQAETVLFRLVRGAGLAGLAGMRMVTADGLIRPLLTSSRAEIRHWAEAEGIRWREDSSNGELRFARNRIRNEVIPALAVQFNSNLEGVLADAAALAQDEEDYWRERVEPIYQEISERTHFGLVLKTEPLGALHVAVQRRVMRRALKEVRGDLRGIDREHVDAILAITRSTEGHDRVMAPGVDALRSFESLLLRRHSGNQSSDSGLDGRHYRVELKSDEWVELPFQAGWICVNRITPGPRNCVNFKKERGLRAGDEAADVNVARLAKDSGGIVPLLVRNWEPGDQLQRTGHSQPEKIKKLFQEDRIWLWERRHWPVVVAGDEIIWVRQFGPAAQFAAATGCAQQIRITYRKFGG